MIWDDDGLVSESRWISRTLPLSEIFLSSSLQKSSSLSLSWWTDSLRSSKETRELKRSSFTSVDSGGAERDWKLYRKQKSKLISSTLHPITFTNIRFDWSLLTQSSTFTASASFFSYSLYHIIATDNYIRHLHYVNFLGNRLYDKTSAKNINVHLTAQAHYL